VYLSLPVPTDRTVSDDFRAYVEGTPFPIQGDKGPVAVTSDVPICFDIIDASRHFEWSNDDVCRLIDRAAAWWDSDKAWLTGRSEHHPFVSVRAILTERLQNLVDALAVVLAESMLNEEDASRETLRRLAAEFGDHGLQVVRLQACCLHIFSEWSESIFRNISSNIGSDTENRVVDGLTALLVVSEREEGSSESESAWSTVCQAVRWRRDAIVRHYLDVVGDMVDRIPEMLSSTDEDLVLLGLRDLASFTEPSDGGLDYLDRLSIRKSAARLAYRLHAHLSRTRRKVPNEVNTWAHICASTNEFAEISNQWKRW